MNCGACGHACGAAANANVTCSAGACRLACSAGFADCDGNATNGCEVNLATDSMHCGSCATTCQGATNAGPACASGVCRLACTAGYADCDMNSANGCETGTDSNLMNCGACGNVCGRRPAADPVCAAGQCTFVCVGDGTGHGINYRDCDGEPDNGCETPVTTADRCTACDLRCDPGDLCDFKFSQCCGTNCYTPHR